MPLLFALVNCNNFYASCQRVFNAGIGYLPIVVHCVPPDFPQFA